MRSILDVVRVQSRRIHEVRSALESARGELNDRKAVDRAKALLMSSLNLSEEEAYTSSQSPLPSLDQSGCARRAAIDSPVESAEVEKSIVSFQAGRLCLRARFLPGVNVAGTELHPLTVARVG
jgi:hypothetical protein